MSEEKKVAIEESNIPETPSKLIGKRTFRDKLTVREAIKNKINITDLIPKEKIKKIPFDLDWKMILRISNSMILDGEKVGLESDIFEVISVFAEALRSGFLGKNSPMQ